jgi:putative heme-binding domain-containing protein
MNRVPTSARQQILPWRRFKEPDLGLFSLLFLFLFLQLAASFPARSAENPHWIWARGAAGTGVSTNSEVWFRREFRSPTGTWNARLTVAADDTAEIFLNGKPVATCVAPGQPVRAEVSMNLHHGSNLLAARVLNRQGAAGLLVHLNMGGSETRELISDTHWVAAPSETAGWNNLGFDATSWAPAASLGAHGTLPWGDILSRAWATPAESLKLLPGYRAELLRSASPEEGSWVCLTFDPRGRLYISPEGDSRPVLRITFNAAGTVDRVEPVAAPIRFAMGLLWAHGSLFANAKGPHGSGLYRLTDVNGNDQFDADEIGFLKAFQGSGEHGYHALKLGPDGRIYVLNGNVTKPPEGVSPQSPYRNGAEDLLSLNPDETARTGGALAPGCHILRTDPDGKSWEIVAGGMRNAYDFDFDSDGEIFVFDSDNEWDWGTPWYRPTRLYHAVSGAEMGWRDRTRAWADTYPDQIDTVVDVGIGSPCGVEFGTESKFPDPYRRALFLQDWSYGRILAVHLEPRGATFRGTFEEFVKGQPLNLTSMRFGPEGALYFITGGRGTQSGLYRVSWIGKPATSTAGEQPSAGGRLAAQARATRRSLERFHTVIDPSALDQIWPFLGDPDRSLRFAARIAVEAQPVDSWKERALSETNAARGLNALLALARCGDSATQGPLLKALAQFPLVSLDEPHRLLKYRVIELSFIRQGLPASTLRELAVEKLSPRYPATTWAENRELCRLLLVLEAPGVIDRTLNLIDTAASREQQIHYIAQLRRATNGWTPESRQRYFRWWTTRAFHLQRPGSLLHWFHDVNRDPVDGAAVDRHLEGFRREAIAAVPPAELEALKPLLELPIAGAQLIPAQPRVFIQEWHLADLLPHLDEAAAGRNFERGRRAFIDTQCYACHRFGDAGGATGPEITAVASKYGRRELLESLVEPSKVISDQYQNLRVFLKDGEEVSGRLVRESEKEIVLETDPLQRVEQSVPRSAIDEMRPSTVSAMPEGLLNVLGLEEILDLIAFLESGGKADAPPFRKP